MLTLDRDKTEGPQKDSNWTFGGTVVRKGSDVDDHIYRKLSHKKVVEIFRDVMRKLPANGVGRDDVVEHWDALKGRLTAEIERML